MEKTFEEFNTESKRSEGSCLLLSILFMLYVIRRHNAILMHHDALAELLAGRYKFLAEIGIVVVLYFAFNTIFLYRESMADTCLVPKHMYIRFTAECIFAVGVWFRTSSIPTAGIVGIIAFFLAVTAAVSSAVVILAARNTYRGELK